MQNIGHILAVVRWVGAVLIVIAIAGLAWWDRRLKKDEAKS